MRFSQHPTQGSQHAVEQQLHGSAGGERYPLVYGCDRSSRPRLLPFLPVPILCVILVVACLALGQISASSLRLRFVQMLATYPSVECAALVCAAIYLLLVRRAREEHDRFLEETPRPRTPDEAHAFTLRYVYGDFHFIAVKSLEFGLFKTYGIPSISSILSETGELVYRCPRRYDDTDLLIREFLEHPPGSPRAASALARMNSLHGRYGISNHDFLYVLCIFMVEPIRWVERFGFRDPHDKERAAMYVRWRHIGERMGIENIPASYDASAEFLDSYEEKYMVYAETNERVAESTMELFLSNVPPTIRSLCRPVVYALCPKRLRGAMGFPDPSPALVWFVESLMVLAAVFVKYLMLPRRVPKTRTSKATEAPEDGILYPNFHPYEKTYEHGYRIEDLGPVHFSKEKAS